jgi:hypothetical protein
LAAARAVVVLDGSLDAVVLLGETVVVATDGLCRIPRRAVTEIAAGAAVEVDSLTSAVTAAAAAAAVVVKGLWVVLLRPAKSETTPPRGVSVDWDSVAATVTLSSTANWPTIALADELSIGAADSVVVLLTTGVVETVVVSTVVAAWVVVVVVVVVVDGFVTRTLSITSVGVSSCGLEVVATDSSTLTGSIVVVVWPTVVVVSVVVVVVVVVGLRRLLISETDGETEGT